MQHFYPIFLAFYPFICTFAPMKRIVFCFVLVLTAISSTAKVLADTLQVIDMRDGLTESRVRQIKQLHDGRIAIATTATIDLYDGTRFESYQLPPNFSFPLPDYKGGHQMNCDSTGLVWLRNNRTLFVLDTKQRQVIANVDSLLKVRRLTASDVTSWPKEDVGREYMGVNNVKCVLHDSYGGLWIGTRENGIVYINTARQRQFHTSHGDFTAQRRSKFCSPRTSQLSTQYAPDATNCTLEPRGGDYAYLGTRHGILIFNSEDSLIATIDSRYGLSNDNVQCLVRGGRDGDIWAATVNGVTRLHVVGRDSFDITNYGRLDGIVLEGREFRENQITTDTATMQIIVGFAGGIVTFHPDSVCADRYTFHFPQADSIPDTTATAPANHRPWLYVFIIAILLLSATFAFLLIKKQKKTFFQPTAKATSIVEQLGSIDETFSRIATEADARTDDERFLAQLKKAVEQHLGDEDFSVQQLSVLMAMDRTVLYRRMQTLTQMTPSNYIKGVRMSVAARLLKETSIPVPEIALQTGFSTTKYFNRVFKDEFGVVPIEYRDKA